MIEQERLSLGTAAGAQDDEEDRTPEVTAPLYEDYVGSWTGDTDPLEEDARLFEGEDMEPRYYSMSVHLQSREWWRDLVDLEFATPEEEYVRRVKLILDISEDSAGCIVHKGRLEGCLPVVEDTEAVTADEIVPDGGLHPFIAWTTALKVQWRENYGILPTHQRSGRIFEVDVRSLIESVSGDLDSPVARKEIVGFLKQKLNCGEEQIEKGLSNAIGEALEEEGNDLHFIKEGKMNVYPGGKQYI